MDRGTCRLQSMGLQRGMTKQLKHTHTHTHTHTHESVGMERGDRFKKLWRGGINVLGDCLNMALPWMKLYSD